MLLFTVQAIAALCNYKNPGSKKWCPTRHNFLLKPVEMSVAICFDVDAHFTFVSNPSFFPNACYIHCNNTEDKKPIFCLQDPSTNINETEMKTFTYALHD